MNSIDRQYKELLLQIIHFGVDKKDRTGTGTKSIFGWQIRHNMKEGFPLLTTKKMAWKSIVTELLWFLRGDTNIKFLVDNGCHIWDGDAYKNFTNEGGELTQEEFINKIKTDERWANSWGDLGPIYGKQWRKWKFTDKFTNGEQIAYVNGNIDQIANLINELKTNPDSRRLLVNAWNVGELEQMVLPPCHYGFQVYTRELSARERTALGSNGSTAIYDSIKDADYMTIGVKEEMHKVCDQKNVPRRAISLMWNQRSVDVPLGLPFNIASYGLLLEIIAKEVNMVPDELLGNLGDCHIYVNQMEGVTEQCTRHPYELPKLVHMKTDEFYKSLSDDPTLFTHLDVDDFKIENYQSHPSIKMPLSN
jgi:thymidylate synthase